MPKLLPCYSKLAAGLDMYVKLIWLAVWAIYNFVAWPCLKADLTWLSYIKT